MTEKGKSPSAKSTGLDLWNIFTSPNISCSAAAKKMRPLFVLNVIPRAMEKWKKELRPRARKNIFLPQAEAIGVKKCEKKTLLQKTKKKRKKGAY